MTMENRKWTGELLKQTRVDRNQTLKDIVARIENISYLLGINYFPPEGTLSRYENSTRIPDELNEIRVLAAAYEIEESNLRTGFEMDRLARNLQKYEEPIEKVLEAIHDKTKQSLEKLWNGDPEGAKGEAKQAIFEGKIRQFPGMKDTYALNQLRLAVADAYTKLILSQHALSTEGTVWTSTNEDIAEAQKLIGKVRATSRGLPEVRADATRLMVEVDSLLGDTYYIAKEYTRGLRVAGSLLASGSLTGQALQRSQRTVLLCTALSRKRVECNQIYDEIYRCNELLDRIFVEDTQDNLRFRTAIWDSIGRAYLEIARHEHDREAIGRLVRQAQACFDNAEIDLNLGQMNWGIPFPSYTFELIRSRLNALQVRRNKRLTIDTKLAIELAQRGIEIATSGKYVRFESQIRELTQKLKIAHILTV